MLTHKEFKAQILEAPAGRTGYERLQAEMELLDIRLSTREEDGLPQAFGKHSPSIAAGS